MSRRNNQFRLMDQIGSIPEKFIEEAEYTRKERARLANHREFARVVLTNQAGEGASSDAIFVEVKTSDTDGYKEVEKTRKNNMVMLVRIAASVSLVAAGLLLFVFLWNPDRGIEPIQTTESSVEQTLPEASTSEEAEPTEAETISVIITREAETEPGTTQASETEESTREAYSTQAPDADEPTSATSSDNARTEIPVVTLPAEEGTTRVAEAGATQTAETENASTEADTTQAAETEEPTTEALPTESTLPEETTTAPEVISTTEAPTEEPTTEEATEPETTQETTEEATEAPTEPETMQEPTTEEATTQAPVLEEPTTEEATEEQIVEIPTEAPTEEPTTEEETEPETTQDPTTEEEQTEPEPTLTGCAAGDHVYELKVVKEPTCTTDGEQIYHCTECGMVFARSAI